MSSKVPLTWCSQQRSCSPPFGLVVLEGSFDGALEGARGDVLGGVPDNVLDIATDVVLNGVLYSLPSA